MRTFRWTPALLAVLLFAGTAVQAAGDPTPDEWAKRLSEKSPSIVYVKFVLNVRVVQGGRSQDREQKGRALGVLLNEKGLVLTSNASFDPGSRFSGRMRSQIEITAKPTDLKVLFGSEEEEYEAQLVARDSSLALAFVQILDLEGRKILPVDLKTGADISVGQNLFGVTRLVRGFDCAPILARLFVTGKVEKPRELWAVSGPVPATGLPVFNEDGIAVGVMSTQQVSSEERRVRRGAFLLPIASLARSLESAEKRAEEALEAAREAAEEEAEEAAEEETPKDEGDTPEDDG